MLILWYKFISSFLFFRPHTLTLTHTCKCIYFIHNLLVQLIYSYAPLTATTANCKLKSTPSSISIHLMNSDKSDKSFNLKNTFGYVTILDCRLIFYSNQIAFNWSMRFGQCIKTPKLLVHKYAAVLFLSFFLFFSG